MWCGPDGRMCGVGLMEGVWCGSDGRMCGVGLMERCGGPDGKSV